MKNWLKNPAFPPAISRKLKIMEMCQALKSWDSSYEPYIFPPIRFLSSRPGRQPRLPAAVGLSVTVYRGTDYNNPRYCGSLSSDIQISQRIGYLKHFDYLWIISEFFCKNKTALSTYLPPCFYLFSS